MKLLILTQKVDSTDDNLGFFHRWVEEFARHCERVTVICLYEGMHDLPENVRVCSLGKEERAGRWAYIVRLYRYIWQERHQYDAVFVHMNQLYILLCGLLWRSWGKRIGLWYAHGSVSISLRIATLLSHVVLTSTPQGFRIATKKKRIVGQGIDQALFANLKANLSDECRLVSWGRISPAKDYMTMVRAVKRLRDANTSVHLDIIGGVGTPEQQAYLDELVAFTTAHDMRNIVTFKGSVPHDRIAKHLTEGCIFLHASTTGSLDKAALEAMVGGLLIITCNESVVSVLPPEERERLTFDAGDDEMLAQKVSVLMRLSVVDRQALSQRLQAVVLGDHSLGGLIPKIITHLSR